MRLFYTTILTLLFFQQILLSQNFHPEKVSLKLMEAMAASPNAHHSINIVLADRVDFEALDADLRTQRVNAGQRSAAVIHALKEKAAQTQGRVLNILQNSNGVIPGSSPNSAITLKSNGSGSMASFSMNKWRKCCHRPSWCQMVQSRV